MTVVGDLTQTSTPGDADSWAQVLARNGSASAAARTAGADPGGRCASITVSGDPPVLPPTTVIVITDPVIDGHFSDGHGATLAPVITVPEPGSP